MTTRKQITFENTAGIQLAAAIEMPVKPIKYFALFAHCFSCGKDIIAASRISRALASIGIAVLRFDFTGIGSSDGDFANTNFSSNIEDILSGPETNKTSLARFKEKRAALKPLNEELIYYTKDHKPYSL